MLDWKKQKMLLLKFPAQFHNFRKTTMGDNLITLSVDRAYSDQVIEVVGKEIGTEFVVYLEDVTSETNLNKDNKEMIDKFRSKLHALLSKYAETINSDTEGAKSLLRAELIKRKLIEKSTTELDIKGYAIACNIVESWK